MKRDVIGNRVGEFLEQATAHQLSGETKMALQTLEEAEHAARTGQHPSLSYVLIQKAGWLRELGRIDEARSALNEAEPLCLSASTEHAALSLLRMEQGIVARRAGDLVLAETLLTEAEHLAQGTSTEIVQMSDILANLSSVYATQGRVEEAQTALLRAITYAEKTNDSRALSSNLNMLGLSYLHTGDKLTAATYFEQSKSAAEEHGLAKETKDATHNLGVVAELNGDYIGAAQAFKAALEAAERAHRQEDIASSKCSLGILAARHEDFDEARRYLTEAYEIHSRLGSAEFSATDLANLAQVEFSAKNYDAALARARGALEIAAQRGLVQILWLTHYRVAMTLTGSLTHDNKDGQDVTNLLNEALEHYDEAADAIELLRSGIGRPEEREHLLIDKERIFGEAMLLAGMLKRADAAWKFVERSRARAFLDSLGASRIERQAERHPLSARRSELTEQLLQMGDTSSSLGRSLLEELRLVRSRISAEAPSVAAVTEAELPTASDAANAIPADTAIVEFYIGPGNHLTTFVLNQKGLAAMHTFDMGNNDLMEKIEQFRAEIQYEVEGEPTGQFLFMLLFGPVWDVLEQVGRLMIVPHKELHYLPFAALWFANSGEGPERIFLCQRFQASILPSVSYLLHALRTFQSSNKTERALVLGNPTQDLPGSEAEAYAVSQILNTNPIIGTDASRDRLLQASGNYSVIHIASHGVYSELDALSSGVVLADGRLSVENILDAHICADLLALSGCMTGISKHAPGDELIGLSRAALAAGIASIITTLWEVEDESAKIFFERFYSHFVSGINKDAALLAAQHEMLAEPQYRAPAHWAPYILLGDCR